MDGKFVQQLQETTVAIPVELTQAIAESFGMNTKDPNVSKLMSLATQKLLTDILISSQDVLKQRPQLNLSKQGKCLLSSQVVQYVCNEKGIKISKPPNIV